MPTVEAALASAKAHLIEADVATPSLDARLLLQHILQLEHADLIANENRQLTDDQSQLYDALISRRLAGEPATRIMGTREFYGREFKTSPAVLDPRPDTETLINLCLEYLPPDEEQTILDLGTGSGILAITLLAERPHKRAVAADISPSALAIASDNAFFWGVRKRITFIESNWFDNIQGTYNLIVSNPPYIPAKEISNLEAEVRNHDPHLALNGGEDGLDPYRAIASGSSQVLAPCGIIAVEIGAGQAEDVITIFKTNGYTHLASHRDLGDHIRALAFGSRL
jgi:release factor glutamine methyltransferase